MFKYVPVNIKDPEHIECLSQLWHDSSVKRYLTKFSMQLDFETFLKQMENPYARLNDLLICFGQSYIGWLECSEYDKDDTNGVVLSYALVPSVRGRGLGKDFLSDFLDSLPVNEVVLEVHDENEAGKALAESLGFSQTETNEEDKTTGYRIDLQNNKKPKLKN